MLICTVVGARPNFVKMAPVALELARRGRSQILVHTGQHYDAEMSQVFFEELGLPKPDIHLEVGSASHARQTAQIMTSFDEVVQTRKPDLVMAGGDVNSTMAVALVAAKHGIPVAHIESGLRSFDRSMPEEINRIVTDHLSDLLFTTEESGNRNLLQEGIASSQVHFVGNSMVDSLFKHVAAAVDRSPWQAMGLSERSYALLTLHRPSNVDSGEALGRILEIIEAVSRYVPVVFPVHPRTRTRMEQLGGALGEGTRLTGPLPYLNFVGLMARARFVLTDSGGIQEETTALGIPCLTMRENTERPVTVSEGTNEIVGTDPGRIQDCVRRIQEGAWKPGRVPPLWDGRASVRIADVIDAFPSSRSGSTSA